MIDNDNGLNMGKKPQEDLPEKDEKQSPDKALESRPDAKETSEKMSEKISKVEATTPKENRPIDPEKNEKAEAKAIKPDQKSQPGEQISIGKILSGKRSDLGLSYEQIVDTTKIRKKYLIALENDDFKVIPNLLAARGFLKIYASFLDLDVNKLVAMFNKMHPDDAAVVNVPANEMSMVDRKYRKDLLSRSLKQTNTSSYDYSKKVKRKKLIFLLTTTLGIILLIAAIIGTSNYYLKRTVGDLKKNPKTKSQMEVPIPKVTPEQLRNKASNVESVYVTAKAINRTWIRVVMDGRVVFSGNMDRGNSKTWTGSQYISIKASRPDRLELMVNGEFVGQMSREAKMKEVTYYLSALNAKQKSVQKNDETEPAETEPAETNLEEETAAEAE